MKIKDIDFEQAMQISELKKLYGENPKKIKYREVTDLIKNGSISFYRNHYRFIGPYTFTESKSKLKSIIYGNNN